MGGDEDDPTGAGGEGESLFPPLPRRSAARRALSTSKQSKLAATANTTANTTATGGNTTAVTGGTPASAPTASPSIVQASPVLSAVPASIDDKQKEKSALKVRVPRLLR